jgi:cytochrome bd-type quinol oxidase subunit 2
LRRISLLDLAARWAGLVGFVLFVSSFALALAILDQRGPLIHLANRVGQAIWYLSLLCFAGNALAVLVLAARHRQSGGQTLKQLSWTLAGCALWLLGTLGSAATLRVRAPAATPIPHAAAQSPSGG